MYRINETNVTHFVTAMAKTTSRKKSVSNTPSPQVLQRAAKLVLSGKCPLSKPTYEKLRKHRVILRKLAAMKGSTRCKKAFITRNKKQVGGILPLIPLIKTAVGVLGPTLLQGMLSR